MNITELIALLEQMRAKHGDIEVSVESNGGYFPPLIEVEDLGRFESDDCYLEVCVVHARTAQTPRPPRPVR